MNKYDDIYKNFDPQLSQFSFDGRVASVFDNMVRRSVPAYESLMDQIALLVEFFFQNETHIYDLGCATGFFFQRLRPFLQKQKTTIHMVDSSKDMITQCSERFDQFFSKDCHLSFVCEDICEIEISDASIVLLNFTLQFIPFCQRDILIQKIYRNLLKKGILILSEKVDFSDPLQRKQMENLHDFFKKKHNYTDLEITQKKKSLENILCPDESSVIEKRFQKGGFENFFQFFQSFQFSSFIAIK